MSDMNSADLLHGMDAIGSFLGVPRRTAEHWAATRDMPVFKVGRAVCARRSGLRTWLAEQEAKGRAPTSENDGSSEGS